MHDLLGRYPVTLLLTLLIEVPWWTVALTALRTCAPRKALVIGVVTSLVTHPLLTLADPGWPWTVAAELIVVAAEAVLAWLLAGRRDLGPVALVSLGANASSYGIGLLLWWAT